MPIIKYKNFEFQFLDPEDSVLFMAVSGAHSYGWLTPESDLDIRYVHVPPLKNVLSFYKSLNTVQWKEKTKGVVDIASYPIQKFFRLLCKGNGNLLENLFQPHIIEKQRFVRELKRIVLQNLHIGYLKHFYGYATNLLKDMENPSRVESYGIEKLILCCYRVLLAGLILQEYKMPTYCLGEQHTLFPTMYCDSILDNYVQGEKIPTKLKVAAVYELLSLQRDLGYITYDDPTFPSLNKTDLQDKLEEFLLSQYI